MIKTLNINDKIYHVDIENDTSLLNVLRKLDFKSVKCGCETSSCGCCTVIMDDLSTYSCKILAIRLNENNKIYTLEHMRDEALKFGEFLIAEGGEQCGFCSPGLIMNVISLKKTGQYFTEEEIEKYLVGNLCRCSGYKSQMRAVKKYLEC